MSSMKIIRKLPPAPAPTRANFHKHPVVGEGHYIKVLPCEYKPKPAPIPPKRKPGPGRGNRTKGMTEQRRLSLEKARAAQKSKAAKREEKIIKLYLEGWSNTAIAAEMDAPIKSIASKLSRLRHDGKIPQRETPDYEKEVIRLYNEGMYIHNIADAVGMREGSVNSLLVRLRRQGKVGNRLDNHWNYEKDSELIRLWRKGVTMREIAKTMHVSDSVIFNHAAKLQREGKISRRKP